MSYLRTTPLIALLALAPILSIAGDRTAQTKVAYHFNILQTDPATKKAVQIGTADYLSSASSTQRFTSFTAEAKSGPDSSSWVIEKTLDLHGVPILTKFSETINGQSRKATAKFVPDGVEVTTDALVDVKTIPLPRGATLADASEEWFKTVTPTRGEQSVTTFFDIRHTAWIKVTTKYVGDLTISIGTKTYQTHRLHIVSDTGNEDYYVDSHGDPVLIDEPPQRVERTE